MNVKVVVALTALLMVSMAFAISIDDESSALVGDNVLDFEKDSAILYLSNGSNTTTFSVKDGTIPAGYSASQITWHLNNLDDGAQLVSFDPDGTQFTASGTSTVAVYAKALGSIEIVAEIPGTDYHASGVIVVFQSPGTQATEFNFFIKVDPSTGHVPDYDSSYGNINTGFWITVRQSDTDIALSDFTAFTALQWYCSDNDWDFNASSYGWINTFLGLGTYEGTNGSWIYWAQYHFDGSKWAFNNTTLNYISTVDSSYIALVFWESPSSDDKPDLPGIDS